MNIYLKDLNGDKQNDIYLEDFQGSGCFPYCLMLLYNKQIDSYKANSCYSDLGRMNFNYQTKLLQSEYFGRTQMSKSRHHYIKDSLTIIDAVYFEHLSSFNDSCAIKLYKYKNGDEILVKEMRILRKEALRFYNNCLWKTDEK